MTLSPTAAGLAAEVATAVGLDEDRRLRALDQLQLLGTGLLGGTREALDEVDAILVAHPAPDDFLTHVRALAAASGPLDDVTAVAVRRSGTP
jgi:hypothetical protein